MESRTKTTLPTGASRNCGVGCDRRECHWKSNEEVKLAVKVGCIVFYCTIEGVTWSCQHRPSCSLDRGLGASRLRIDRQAGRPEGRVHVGIVRALQRTGRRTRFGSSPSTGTPLRYVMLLLYPIVSIGHCTPLSPTICRFVVSMHVSGEATAAIRLL
jgi:hypothetical protein